MAIKTFLDFLPSNYRHEKSYLIKHSLHEVEKLSTLSDIDINEIQGNSPLCTTNNLKKVRAIAIFKKELAITPTEACLLLHSGISSIKSLSQLTPYDLEHKIGRLERSLRVKTEAKITLLLLKEWIKRAKKVHEAIENLG